MSKMTDYLNKEALGTLEAVGELSQNAMGLLSLLVAIPAAGGVVTGLTASKMSSPTDSDTKALQSKVMDVAVREELALQQRKLDAMKRRKKATANTPSIGRKRDMFV